MREVENYRARILTISGTDRYKKIVNGQEVNFLAIELVDKFEVKDLGINWVDKEIYSLLKTLMKLSTIIIKQKINVFN